MKFFRTYDSAASKGKWKEFVDEMEFDSMLQEPRTMAQEPRIGLQGGQLVEPGIGRPGYGGPGSGAKKGPIPALTSTEKKIPLFKKFLSDLPEGYLEDYKRLFLNIREDGTFSVKSGEAAGIAEMEKKYGKILKTHYPSRQKNKQGLKFLDARISDINSAILKDLKSGDSIVPGLKDSDIVRRADLKIVGDIDLKAPPGKAKHHFMPLAGVEGEKINLSSTKNTAFIDEKLNKAMSPYDKKLKANQKEQIKLLNEKPTGYKIRIKQLNYKAKNIYKEAGKKVPDSKGLLGYSQINVKPDGTYDVKVTGIDPKKSFAGLEGEEIIYKNLSKVDKSKLKKSLEENLLKLGNGSKKKAIAKLKSGNLTSAEKKIVDAMGDGLKKGGMPKKFWTTALKGEGYFALADFANNLTKGQSLDKSFSNAVEAATFGALDIGGNERDLMKYAEERGLDTKDMKEWMDYAETYGKYVEGYTDLKWAEKIKEAEGEFTPSHILNPEPYTGRIDEIEQAKSAIEKAEGQLEEKEKFEGVQSGKGYKDLNEMIEGAVAKEWNRPAGIAGLDRGYRKMLGMKGDEGMIWGPIGNLFREGAEKLGFGEHDALKGFTPQTVMNYHPVYGYKEDIKDVIREGDSPMEDMLYYMEKYYPSSGLVQEALRTKKEDLKEKEKWVQTGFGRKKRKVKKDMGIYDYDPNLAEGGIASLKKW